ncbi:MAG: putative hydrolase or acyltransferase of alpha/beta superfamily [Microbacteriaceae bacterium]|nr:putative hydrolase or acyltransferase of alpha/beta superfamily [Microbacteriaceae bacterium]
MTTPTETAAALPFDDLEITPLHAFDAATGTLAGGRCSQCDAQMFPKAFICFSCMSDQVLDEPLVAEGTLYSFTTIHISPTFATPYSIGYVDLVSGVRVLGQLAGEATDFSCDSPMHAIEDEQGPTGWAFTPTVQHIDQEPSA